MSQASEIEHLEGGVVADDPIASDVGERGCCDKRQGTIACDFKGVGGCKHW